MKSKWERITEDGGEKTDRMRIDDGYLYRTRAINTHGSSVAMVFVPNTPTAISITPPADRDEVDDGKPVNFN